MRKGFALFLKSVFAPFQTLLTPTIGIKSNLIRITLLPAYVEAVVLPLLGQLLWSHETLIELTRLETNLTSAVNKYRKGKNSPTNSEF